MRLKAWEELPDQLKTESVRPYYDALRKKQGALFCKRLTDLLLSAALLVVLSPVLLVLAICIKIDSPGTVFFRQVRVTQYGREFRIFKFRTMVQDAPKLGSAVTVKNDMRITRMGRLLRGCRLDELPQLINILKGEMSFVGTRPEVPKYVSQYTPEMMATLLLPAGVTSEASIQYKDEDRLLDGASDPDKTYVEQVLPGKMAYNLQSLLGRMENDAAHRHGGAALKYTNCKRGNRYYDEGLDYQPLRHPAVDGRAGAALLFLKIPAGARPSGAHLHRQRNPQHRHQHDPRRRALPRGNDGRRARAGERPDVIYTSAPTIFAAASAVIAAKRLKVPCVVEVRDIWPESIVEYKGMSRKNPIIVALYALEKKI